MPLTPMAREIIASMPNFSGKYVFSANGTMPVAGFSRAKRQLDTAMPGKPWRLHDLRRTAVTCMARAGADLHVIERAINHTSGSFAGIVGASKGTGTPTRYAPRSKRGSGCCARSSRATPPT